MNHLKLFRFKREITQLELFKKTGIWPSKISYIENRYLEPNEVERKKLAAALNVSEKQLFPRRGKKKQGDQRRKKGGVN